MTYDNYGNILTKNGITYTYGDSVWKDKLTAYNGQSISYDAQGNPTSYLGHTLTWEKGRQLKSFDNISYTYNANGIRTGKTVGGVKHTYVLEGTNILKETWGSNELVPMYDNEENVCGIIYNGTPYCFRKNLQGDIISITNIYGNEIARYSYDAWGVCSIVADVSDDDIASVNPYRYRGYHLDVETGLYYLQSRYYDPVVGRFVNGDESKNAVACEISLESNLFCYCQCEPVNDIDDNGKISAKKVRQIFKKIKQWAKKIINLVQDYINDRLKLYTGLSPSDISKIAKDIKRSPHRVRQAIESLNKKLSKAKTRVAKIARAITLISVVSSVSSMVNSVKKGKEVATIISKNIIIGLVELIKGLVGKGIKKLTSAIPAIGVFLSFALAQAVEVVLNKIFTSKYIKNVTNTYEKRIAGKIKTYKAYNYFVTFIDCWT